MTPTCYCLVLLRRVSTRYQAFLDTVHISCFIKLSALVFCQLNADCSLWSTQWSNHVEYCTVDDPSYYICQILRSQSECIELLFQSCWILYSFTATNTLTTGIHRCNGLSYVMHAQFVGLQRIMVSLKMCTTKHFRDTPQTAFTRCPRRLQHTGASSPQSQLFRHANSHQMSHSNQLTWWLGGQMFPWQLWEEGSR